MLKPYELDNKEKIFSAYCRGYKPEYIAEVIYSGQTRVSEKEKLKKKEILQNVTGAIVDGIKKENSESAQG